MGIFGQRNKAAERAANEVMRPAGIRRFLMLILLVLMALAYGRHFDNRLAEIEARAAFSDEAGLWSQADRRALGRRAKLFRDQWGIRVVVHVRRQPVEIPELSPAMLFLGIAPDHGEAVLVLPGLAARALREQGREAGRDPRAEEERDLARCLQSGGSGADCVMKTLDSLASLFLAW